MLPFNSQLGSKQARLLALRISEALKKLYYLFVRMGLPSGLISIEYISILLPLLAWDRAPSIIVS